MQLKTPYAKDGNDSIEDFKWTLTGCCPEAKRLPTRSRRITPAFPTSCAYAPDGLHP
jgi:hypothetical protein